MSASRFPFRFYGREPADWSPPQPAYVYELQFERAVSPAQRDALHARYARALAEGPAAPGGEAWWWSGDRFAVILVRERYADAPRMVFDRVAQLLVDLHAVARLRDVVFSNAWGARSGRWDTWSVERQQFADAGPPRPDAPFAQLLRRELDERLPPYEAVPVEAPARPAAQPAPRPAAARAPTITLEVVDPFAYPPPQPEDLGAFRHAQGEGSARWDEVIPDTHPPLARAYDARRPVAVAHVNAEGERVETPFPADAPPTGPAATDVDGVRAVVASGNAIYDIHLGDAKPVWRMAIHLNNGTVRALAWVCDNLWAVLADQQMMVDDLSGPSPMYVGAVRIYGGTAMRSARHGTILVIQVPHANVIVGVCAWQLRELASLDASARFAYECDGELIFARGEERLRAVGVEEAYEAWAAPLRKRAEADRKRRFANAKAKRPPAKPHWIHVEDGAVPAWRHQARRDALKAALARPEDWLTVGHSGAALTVESEPGKHWSRGAALRYAPAQGERGELGGCVDFARAQGVTNLDVSPDGRYAWVIDGLSFNVYRVDLHERVTVGFGANPFLRHNGLLVNVVALGPEDFVALWVDCLVWLRRKGNALAVVHALKLKWTRGFAYEPSPRRFIITSQDRARLLVVRAENDLLTIEAKFTDGVKEAMFRDGKIYAQMTDGVWFELRGL